MLPGKGGEACHIVFIVNVYHNATAALSVFVNARMLSVKSENEKVPLMLSLVFYRPFVGPT